MTGTEDRYSIAHTTSAPCQTRPCLNWQKMSSREYRTLPPHRNPWEISKRTQQAVKQVPRWLCDDRNVHDKPLTGTWRMPLSKETKEREKRKKKKEKHNVELNIVKWLYKHFGLTVGNHSLLSLLWLSIYLFRFFCVCCSFLFFREGRCDVVLMTLSPRSIIFVCIHLVTLQSHMSCISHWYLSAEEVGRKLASRAERTIKAQFMLSRRYFSAE